MQAAPGFVVELVEVGFQVSDQGGTVQLALCGLAQAVEFEPHIFQAKLLPQGVRQQNNLGVNLCAGKAQCLRADLVKLPVAPALWPLMPKHRTHVIQALAAFVQQVVLGHRAHDAGRVFRPQGERLTIESVLKRVHLFFDNVCNLAKAAHKQRSRFHNRCADVAVGITHHQVAHCFLKRFPASRGGRQYVVHAFDGN